MTDQIVAEAGEWTSRHGTRPTIKLLRIFPNGRRVLLAPVDYRQARALADAIHDLVDAHEARQRNPERNPLMTNDQTTAPMGSAS